jgi:hypothetical protein
MMISMNSIFYLLFGLHSSFGLMNTHKTARYGVWGNYKSDGSLEGKIILSLACLFVLKGTFTSINLRTTYPCPTGLNSDRILKEYQIDPEYKCLPADEVKQ